MDAEDYNLNGSIEGLSIDDLEARLIANLDRTTDKNAKTRIDALKRIRIVLSNKFMNSFALNRRDTITEAIKRCLRKGKIFK